MQCQLREGDDPPMGVTGLDTDTLDSPVEDVILRRRFPGKIGQDFLIQGGGSRLGEFYMEIHQRVGVPAFVERLVYLGF